MNNCSKCNRPLNEGETGLCPACQSARDAKWKRVGEVALAVVVIVGTGLLAVFTGGKGGKGGRA